MDWTEAPIPMAREPIAVSVNTGRWRKPRNDWRVSRSQFSSLAFGYELFGALLDMELDFVLNPVVFDEGAAKACEESHGSQAPWKRRTL